MSRSDDRLRVIVIDSDDLARAGLEALLRRDPQFDLVEVVNGQDLDRVVCLNPDILILDPFSEPQAVSPNLLDIVTTVGTEPSVRLCFYTTNADPCLVAEALREGLSAYLLKRSTDWNRLRAALIMVGRFGGTVIEPTIARLL